MLVLTSDVDFVECVCRLWVTVMGGVFVFSVYTSHKKVSGFGCPGIKFFSSFSWYVSSTMED